MTNATMEALAELLRSYEANDDYICYVVDALEAYRIKGGPVEERLLQDAIENYMKEVQP